ncbi:MAG: hypothetical protein ACK559_08780, partial [bacterium]
MIPWWQRESVALGSRCSKSKLEPRATRAETREVRAPSSRASFRHDARGGDRRALRESCAGRLGVE